jgi:hypothetical protein
MNDSLGQIHVSQMDAKTKMNLIERDHPLRKGNQLHLSLQLYQMKFQEPKLEKAQSANTKKKPKRMKQKKDTSSEGPSVGTHTSF